MRLTVRGYRSLRDVTLPLSQVNIITGANGLVNRTSIKP